MKQNGLEELDLSSDGFTDTFDMQFQNDEGKDFQIVRTTGTDIRTPYYIESVYTLEAGETYTLKVEFSSDSQNKEATIYSNLFQVEQKTVK